MRRLLFWMVLLSACTAGNRPATNSSVVAALRDAGAEVKEVETLEQPFFSVPAHIHTIDGEDLQIYEFPSVADADRAAAQVDARGSTIGTTKMSWLAAPHFYRKDRVIAIHLGDSPIARAALERVFGKSFAGHD